MPKPAAPSAKRDRKGTETGIVEAAIAVIIAEGFAGFGINAVARRAGCDKQLIYRYFGGLDGLVDAIGANLAGWVERQLAPISAMPQPGTYRDLVERFVLGYLHAFKADTLMQKIVVWEVAQPSPVVLRLADARSKAMKSWVDAVRGNLQPPTHVDAAAGNAILLSAVHHLVLAGASTGRFAGLPLRTESDWERVREALLSMIAGLYRDDTAKLPRGAAIPSARKR